MQAPVGVLCVVPKVAQDALHLAMHKRFEHNEHSSKRTGVTMLSPTSYTPPQTQNLPAAVSTTLLRAGCEGRTGVLLETESEGHESTHARTSTRAWVWS